jgi:GTP pyrophosphokinase
VRAGSGSEGPSRDWLNPQLGYARSQRTRAKVRQWFNALELERDLSAGREKVEKMLQREGRTALAFDELARRMGFERPDDLFLAVAREEVGPRMLEEAAGVRRMAPRGRAAARPGRPAPSRVRSPAPSSSRCHVRRAAARPPAAACWWSGSTS